LAKLATPTRSVPLVRAWSLPGAIGPVPWPLLAVVVPVSLAIVGLLLFVVWLSLLDGLPGAATTTYSLRYYAELAADPFARTTMLNTLGFTAITLLVALGFGLPTAWLVERTDLPRKGTALTIMSVGLLIPNFFLAMGWLFLLHPRIGWINVLVMQMFGLDEAPFDVGTVPGMGFVYGLALAPLVVIMVAAAFRSMDPALEDAAIVHGAGFWTTLRRVTLPLLLPSTLAAAIYVAALGIAAFEVPAVLGLSSRVFTFSTYIFAKTNPPSGTPQYGVVAAFSTGMLMLSLLLSFWYSRILQRARRYEVITGKGYQPRPLALGRKAWLAWAFLGLYFLMSRLLPFVFLLFAAFSPYFQPPSLEALQSLSLDNFARLPWNQVRTGATNTAILVLAVPTVALVISVAFSWVVLRTRLRLRYAFESVAFLPQAVPEIIFAVGALFAALFFLRGAFDLYGTLALLLIVYVLLRVSFATRVLNGALVQVHRELEEAAYTAGASEGTALWRIVVPLLKPALLNAWLWMALLTVRELTVVTILFAATVPTLPLVVWGLWHGGNLTQSAAATLVMVGALLPLLALYAFLGERQRLPGA
jgi:iron(III) transport system permease protein